MPLRWIVCPVLTSIEPDGTRIRRAALDDLADLGKKPAPVRDAEGRPTGETKPHGFNYSAVIRDGVEWCLCIVRCVDTQTLDEAIATKGSGFVNVLGRDYEDGDNFLARTPADLGWDSARRSSMKTAIESVTKSAVIVNASRPLHVVLAAVGSAIRPGWQPRGTYVADSPASVKR